jgi:outer membrane immunogenic protein
MTARQIFAAAALIATTSAASAADLSRPVYKSPAMAVAAYNWSGLYAGIHVGYTATRADFTSVIGTTSANGDGVLFGGQVGYNWQAIGSPWVFGIEADVSGIGSDEPSTTAVNSAIVGFNAIGTARVRAGYATDRILWYVTGGYAWSDTELKLSGPAFGGTLTNSKTHSGWTLGAGVEWAFADAWTAKIEYLYMNFGEERFFPGIVGASGLGIEPEMHTIKGGLNYRFGAGKGPVVAAY